MAHNRTSLELNKAESIVLMEFLLRISNDERLTIEHAGETQLLWDLCAMLETKVPELFLPNWNELVARARVAINVQSVEDPGADWNPHGQMSASVEPKANGGGPKMAILIDRITVDPDQCGGKPCIRGMRIRVTDVLDLLASGLTPDQIIEELPDLQREDVQACLRFASTRLNHPVLVP